MIPETLKFLYFFRTQYMMTIYLFPLILIKFWFIRQNQQWSFVNKLTSISCNTIFRYCCCLSLMMLDYSASLIKTLILIVSNYVLVMKYDSTDTLIMILDILSPSINLRHYYGTWTCCKFWPVINIFRKLSVNKSLIMDCL